MRSPAENVVILVLPRHQTRPTSSFSIHRYPFLMLFFPAPHRCTPPPGLSSSVSHCNARSAQLLLFLNEYPFLQTFVPAPHRCTPPPGLCHLCLIRVSSPRQTHPTASSPIHRHSLLPLACTSQMHSPTKPVLIFVSSRRQTRLTALDLITCAGEGSALPLLLAARTTNSFALRCSAHKLLKPGQELPFLLSFTARAAMA